MIWVFLLASMLTLTVLGFVFILRRSCHFAFLNKIKKTSRKKAYFISFLLWMMIIAALSLWGGIINMMVCMIHLIVFWILFDGVSFLLEKVRGKRFCLYYSGGITLIFTCLYLAYGIYTDYHVVPTDYRIQADEKENVENSRGFDSNDRLSTLKIVGFSDSHVGATFHADQFREYVDQMNAEKPDLFVIAGDFVDDDTSYEDMVKCCEALSHLNTKYGVYYVFGNHDCGYYGRGHRGYGKEELVENLEKNHVIVLEDEVVPIVDQVYLCGRQDTQQRDRKTMKELRASIPEDAKVIVLDHEPNDYDAQKESKVDLVISGHTHGGQLIPIIHVGEWIGANDFTYGYDKRDHTNFIVSSGISDWALKIKTGCISEYLNIEFSYE